ncbi:type II secretion system F family protein [Micromonospora soli]|uniref:type II secretion system F family protein n=1 Tax=Micromonospora sp. NBRC 110009 TaxID=3061627 RepID=UPI0026730E1A|nr:type II secretion system F family protein [Micromonospora sp. NBRC 110009]WKU00633.1 type II secretion system F family protein [Micromonospora sp. NBRC 110009]
MSRQVVAAGLLAAAALLVLMAGGQVGRPGRRLSLLARPSGVARTRPSWWPDRFRLASGAAGVAAAVVVGGWGGLFAGVLTGLLADRLLRRVEPRAVRDRRLREAVELPLAADLLAAALRAGAPVDRSVLAVAEALGGPLADRLGRVGRTLELGGTAAEAWAHLDRVPGGERLLAAAIRSSDSGAALAGALTRLADDLRSGRATAAEAAARRGGVLIVLPLGLCFLPAFILAGLVPVIVAVLGDVL